MGGGEIQDGEEGPRKPRAILLLNLLATGLLVSGKSIIVSPLNTELKPVFKRWAEQCSELHQD